MANKIDLFHVLKLNTSYIIKNNLQIQLTYQQAIDDNLIVALGDNQLFKFIRDIRMQDSLIKDIRETKQMIAVIGKQMSNNFNKSTIESLNNRLKLLTFVPDIVAVKTDTTKKDYKGICKNHFAITFDIFGTTYTKEYKRLCAGAGQLRRNTVFFVDKEIYNELETIMLCGLTKGRVGKINLAKFSAYFSLYSSATRQVKTPRICVVDDFEYTLKDQTVDWIFDNELGEKDVEERVIDFDINAFDGSGMISPRMAQQWQEDLGLDYLPSSFIVRSAWVKGLVSVFDFHKFANEVAHTTTITDIYGETYDIENIDVILTKSQFKLHY